MLRLVVYLMLATALYVILRWKDSYAHLLSVINSSLTLVGPFRTALFVALLAIPVFKLAAAAGLLMKRAWAWVLALVVLGADFAIRFQAAVRLHLQSDENMDTLRAALSKGATVVHTESMWPSYVIGVISLLSLIVLLSGPIRKRFLR